MKKLNLVLLLIKMDYVLLIDYKRNNGYKD